MNYAVVHHLGNTISNSWSGSEGFGNPAGLIRIERILEMAAAKGVDVNFSSGDDGDDVAQLGFATVDYPGSSPFATSVGGTSLILNPTTPRVRNRLGHQSHAHRGHERRQPAGHPAVQ